MGIYRVILGLGLVFRDVVEATETFLKTRSFRATVGAEPQDGGCSSR
jgi:hypothetical protein